MSSFLHFTMAAEEGLFQQVIVESMGYPVGKNLDVAESLSNTFISSAGCGSSSNKLSCLRAVLQAFLLLFILAFCFNNSGS